MANLPLTGKEQHCFSVFMLQAECRYFVEQWNVESALLGWMWIELHAYLADCSLKLPMVSVSLQEVCDAIEMLWFQHARLRKGELKHGIIGDSIPIDQLIDNVMIDAKRQHRSDYAHCKALLGTQAF